MENRALPITEIDLLEIIAGRGLHIARVVFVTLFELRARKTGEEAGPLDALQASGESMEWTTLLDR